MKSGKTPDPNVIHPIAGYDKKTKRAYLEYPDGSREYVE